jgi:putative oxidoreductase
MSADAPGNSRTIAIWALRVILGVAFLAIGTTKLTGTANTIPYFAAIGWGQWFRYLTGLLDVAGAALIFVPRLTCLGACMLLCSVGTGTLLSVTVLRGNPTFGGTQTVLVPFVFTLLAALLAWLTRPHRTV